MTDKANSQFSAGPPLGLDNPADVTAIPLQCVHHCQRLLAPWFISQAAYLNLSVPSSFSLKQDRAQFQWQRSHTEKQPYLTTAIESDGPQPTPLQKSQLFSKFQSQRSCRSETWKSVRTAEVLPRRHRVKVWDDTVKPLRCHNFIYILNNCGYLIHY